MPQGVMFKISHILCHVPDLTNDLRLITISYNGQHSITTPYAKYKGSNNDTSRKMLLQRYSGSSKTLNGTLNLDDFINQYRYALRDLHIQDSVSVQFLHLILKEDALVFYRENL